jgi:succinylglutamate desuccinylase
MPEGHLSKEQVLDQELIPIEPPMVRVLDSGNPGPHVAVIGGMHGDEPSAVRFLKGVLSGQEELTPDRGSVAVVIANPTAYERGVRAVNLNLNSMLTTAEVEAGPQPEFKSARLLMNLLVESDACIDLHEHKDIGVGSIAMAPLSSAPIASSLGADLFVHGLETVEPGATDAYMAEIGRLGICLELGYHQEDNTAIAREAVRRFLSLTGVLVTSEASPPKPRVARARSLLVRQTSQFNYAPHVRSGEVLPPGVFAWDGGEELSTSDDTTGVLFPRPTRPVGASVGILIDFEDEVL